MGNLTKEEFMHVLRRQSTGFPRGSSKYRGVTLHKCGRWESRLGQFLNKKYNYIEVLVQILHFILFLINLKCPVCFFFFFSGTFIWVSLIPRLKLLGTVFYCSLSHHHINIYFFLVRNIKNFIREI